MYMPPLYIYLSSIICYLYVSNAHFLSSLKKNKNGPLSHHLCVTESWWQKSHMEEIEHLSGIWACGHLSLANRFSGAIFTHVLAPLVSQLRKDHTQHHWYFQYNNILSTFRVEYSKDMIIYKVTHNSLRCKVPTILLHCMHIYVYLRTQIWKSMALWVWLH